jgi:hypothetical protein
MGNVNVSGVESVGSGSRANNVYALNSASSSADQEQSINQVTNSLSQALTGGGKAQFDSPGAEQDFQKNLRSAVSDIIQGAQSGDKAQMSKGIESLMSLLEGLKGSATEGAGDTKGAEGGGAPAGGAPESGEASGSSAEDALQKLIEMLLKMGVPPEAIAKLLQALGMSPEQANSMVAKAGQGEGAGAGNNTAGGNTAVNNPNALAA